MKPRIELDGQVERVVAYQDFSYVAYIRVFPNPNLLESEANKRDWKDAPRLKVPIDEEQYKSYQKMFKKIKENPKGMNKPYLRVSGTLKSRITETPPF